MMQETMRHVCRVCRTTKRVKNGTKRCGNAHDQCKDGGASRVLTPKQASSKTEHQTNRSTELCHDTANLVRGSSKRTSRMHLKVKETLLPATPGEVLERDDVCSVVGKKDQARWRWMARCRRTRHIVAFALGDRSKATCLRLWQAIPHDDKHGHPFSDFWHASHYVFPAQTPHGVGKETGETAQRERWNNLLRQRVGRYVRQTLSFSKSDASHERVTRWFIIQ